MTKSFYNELIELAAKRGRMRFSYVNFYIFFMNRASHFELVGRMCYDSCIILNGLHLFPGIRIRKGADAF